MGNTNVDELKTAAQVVRRRSIKGVANERESKFNTFRFYMEKARNIYSIDDMNVAQTTHVGKCLVKQKHIH